jgi:DNA-binding GntR family transcriptional regulator
LNITDNLSPMTDEGDELPLWQRVAADLRGRIQDGEITGRIESEERLTLRYAVEGRPVSRDTIRRALLTLELDGLIRRSDRGREVIPPAERA